MGFNFTITDLQTGAVLVMNVQRVDCGFDVEVKKMVAPMVDRN
jgi:hypothetical protein